MNKLYWSSVGLIVWIVAGSLVLLLYSSDFTVASIYRVIETKIPDWLFMSFLFSLIILAAMFQQGIIELGENAKEFGEAIDRFNKLLDKRT